MKHTLSYLKKNLSSLLKKLDLSFFEEELFICALTHRSYLNEQKEENLTHNERLEFLGDSVLGLIVSEYLYEKLPDEPEGVLSQIKSRLVDGTSCSRYFLKLGIEEFILLGKGEFLSVGKSRYSIYADMFEALLAAIYLDKGLIVAKKFVLKHFSEDFESIRQEPSINFKAELQDVSQRLFQKPPEYVVVKEEGPDHAKLFFIQVLVDGKEAGEGVGPSKKEAEQSAAKNALERFRE